ncbi:MAG: amino acid adenylation domain-containing protein, partial [Thiotrichaceae bacterium]|nr:amino acid adenylation domain-containing protein [Thiotrichaceae bacterium]
LTYQQLNEKANQLAHYLQKMGIETETLIGICVERSFEMIVGLLGIIKAGAAYLPLDPTYPKERLAFMLQDANAPILLTQQHLLTILPQHQAQLICLDSDWSKIVENNLNNLNLNIQLENLAYVIYTSGSTGKPKGVLLEHKGLTNIILEQIEQFFISDKSSVLQFASISFDAAVSEIFTALVSGAQLALAAPDEILAGQNLLNFLHNKQISVATIPPSILSTVDQTSLPYLKTLVVAGEKCSIQVANAWMSSKRHFINAYGPTETTICSSIAHCRPNNINNILPIGRPISNVKVFVLDKYLQQMPIGIIGELYVAGINVARGYLKRPELTTQKFVQNVFSNANHDYLYKTGDLVRFLPDGQLEFIGRIDTQIKIRGFRIELGEIEAILNNYPTVQTACVIVREDQANDKYIAAYFVAQKNIKFSELQEFMLQSLPDYMLPKMFVQLEKFLLTPNGKIDQKALPIPEAKTYNKQDFIAPRNEIEQILASIWSQVLNIEKMSINDNFFSLGGDSILSIQVVAQANQHNIKLTPRLIFQYQTIAQLAVIVDVGQIVQAQQDLVTGEMPLTAIQHWFFEQDLTNFNYYNQSVLLKVANDIQPQLLEKAINHLLIHHDALRLQFQKIDNQWQQQNLAEVETFKLEVIDLQNDAQLLTETQIAQASLNIEKAKLINASLFKNTMAQTGYLFVTIHHLAVDGVSWRILLEDLSTAYQQLLQQKKVQLSLKTTAFLDWSNYLQQYMNQAEQYIDFWLQQVVSMPIPIDFNAAQTENIVQSSAEICLSLTPEQTTDLLKHVCQAYNTKINDILLTALALTLSDWTEQKAVLLDLEGHGRELINDDFDLSRTIGWFTSLYPVTLRINKDLGLAESIKSIKEQLRQIPNNGFDYAILRYLNQNLEIRQKLQDLPQAQISFNYLGQFEQQNELFSGIATEKTAAYHDKLNKRAYLIDFSLIILNEKLEVNCTYSSAFFQSETIQRLAQNYITHLQTLIEHCLAPQTGGYTPSDFPDADLNQDDLDNLLDQL